MTELICIHCGRRGTRGFVISSGNGDGTRDSYACASFDACQRRQLAQNSDPHEPHFWYERGVGVHWRCQCGEASGVAVDDPAASREHLQHVLGPDGYARLIARKGSR